MLEQEDKEFKSAVHNYVCAKRCKNKSQPRNTNYKNIENEDMIILSEIKKKQTLNRFNSRMQMTEKTVNFNTDQQEIVADK